MNETCQEYQVLISAYASGEQPAPESERLLQHLAGCQACRREAEQTAAVLEAARFPPPTEAELRSLEGLQSRVIGSWNRSQRRRGLWRQSMAALGGAAAAAALLLLLPGTVHRQVQTEGESTVAVEWQSPDVDELWDTSAVVDVAEDEELALADDSQVYASWEDAY
jgi:anti-sigma factor RsiW